jgi:putative ABC transport system substrate-binding protein
VLQIVGHPALDAAVLGFKETLLEAGYREGVEVEYMMSNAEGDPQEAAAMAEEFGCLPVDLVFSVSTPATQAAAEANPDLPLIFAAVTDPVAAGLMADPAAPPANLSGVSDRLPLIPHLELVKELVPDATRLGLLYNPTDPASYRLVRQESVQAQVMGFEVVEARVLDPGEALSGAQSLIGRVDAISVLTDSTVVAALESVVRVAEENRIPLIAGDAESVQRGAAACYSFDYTDIGKQAGRMAVKVLGGADPGDLAVEYPQSLQLVLNEAAAERMGARITSELRARVRRLF